MKPMDLHQFRKWITGKGYSIGTSTNHHTIVDQQGKVVARFAITHKAGAKDYVKPAYIKIIQSVIGP